MTETEIRRVLRELCEDLDRTARRVILPAALGAGMALSAGCGNRPVPAATDGGNAVPAATDGGSADQRTQGRTDGQPLKWDLSGPLGVDHRVPPPQPDYIAAWQADHGVPHSQPMYMPAWPQDAQPPKRDVVPLPRGAYGVPLPATDAK